MNRAIQLHDLLPWFATGKLREEESVAFRAHLDECATCREELVWVRKVQERLDERGPELLEDHPTPDELVAAVRGESNEQETTRVRRHLALCSTCELEARWAAGDAVADVHVEQPFAVGFWNRHGAWGWGLAAAAMLTLAVVFPMVERRDAAAIGPLKPFFIVPMLLADTPGQNVLELAPGDGGLLLVLEADFPAASFPIEVEITRVSGRRVVHHASIDRDHLVRQLYLMVPCPKSACSPGRYSARLRASDGGDTVELAFEIAE